MNVNNYLGRIGIMTLAVSLLAGSADAANPISSSDVIFDAAKTAPILGGDNNSCTAINNSNTTLCSEEDNVNIPFFGKVVSFDVVATHPLYNVGADNYSCPPDFNNCIPSNDSSYNFTPGVFKLFDDHETVVEAVREASWWRPFGMLVSVDSNTPVTDIHYVRVYRKIAEANEWPQFFVLYMDGNVRLIPHPPPGVNSVCFGSSVIIGPAAVASRPIAEIASAKYISSSKTMEVIYRSGGSTILSLSGVNRSMARVQVTVNYSTDSVAFATFRSMFVSNGNGDVDHVRWKDASGMVHDEAIMEFQGGEGTEWLFYRSNWSRHNPSAPDIALKNFILDTAPPSVANPSSNQSDIPDDTDNIPLWGETARLNVTVTDESNISSVTINLSEIGGLAAKPMVNIGGSIYSTTTNATAGTPPRLYNLTVNATDIYGNSNTSVRIQLKVMKNGDTTGNGVVDIGDALRLANNVSYPAYYPYYLYSIYVAEVTGNGKINIGDALRLANNVSYPGNPAYILR